MTTVKSKRQRLTFGANQSFYSPSFIQRDHYERVSWGKEERERERKSTNDVLARSVEFIFSFARASLRVNLKRISEDKQRVRC